MVPHPTLESLFQQTKTGAVTQDAQLRILWHNPAATEVLGLTGEQLLGRTSYDPQWHAIREDLRPFPGEDHPAAVALRTGEPVHGVVMGIFRPSSGTYRWLQIDSIPTVDAQGMAVVHTLFHDITAWKTRDDQLASEQKLFVKGPVMVLRLTGSPLALEAVTENFATVLGLEPEPYLTGKETLWSRVHPDDLPTLQAQFSRMVHDASEGTVSGMVRFLDGRGRWLTLGYQTLYHPGGPGRPPSALAYWIDRTDETRTLQRLALTLEAAKTGTWEWSAKTGGVTVDTEWVRLLGHPESHDHFFDLPAWRAQVHPDDRPGWDAQVDEVFSGDLVAFEMRVRQSHLTDGWVWFRIRGKVVEADGHNHPLRILGTNEDIREEVLVEEERVILSQVVEQGPSAVILTDPEGRIEYVNAEFSRMTGYTLDEIQGQNPRILRSPATEPRVYRELWTTILAGRPWHGEFQNLRKDRSPLWVQASISPLKDSQGRITRYAGQQIDITARKAMEDEALTQYRFQVLLTEISIKLLRVRPEDEADRMTEILGELGGQFQADRVLFGFAGRDGEAMKVRGHWQSAGTPISPVVGLHAAPFWKEALLGEEEVFVIGVPTQVPWADLPVCSVLAVPFMGGLGDPGLLILEASHSRWTRGSLVTAQVVANTFSAHFQRMRDENRILEAQRAADRANEAKSLFLATMSHEVRNPINGILGMADLALDQEVPSQVRTYLEGIRSSAEALLSLVGDVLDLSKIEAGKLELESLDFRLAPFLETVLLPLRVLAGKKGLFLDLKGPEAGPEVVAGDPTRLRQVITNIVGNALKFTKEGGVVLWVRFEGEASPTGGFRFEVQDTGPGVPPGARDKLFKNFSQAEASVARLHGGTGLGLAICRQLVEKMGGRIGYQDAVDPPGARFWFTVPLTPGDPRRVEEARAPLPALSLGNLRVLVAEDNPVNQAVLSGMLGKHGIRPTLAADGLQALDHLRSDRFDLVLMDVQMPHLDGMEAARAIRRGEAGSVNQGVRIVALTAHTRPSDLEEAKEAGMDSSLTKPVSADLLAGLLGAAMKGPVPENPLEREKRTFDVGEMRSRLQLEDSYLAQIVQLFLQGLPARREALAGALAEGRIQDLQRVAHTLKGTAANLVAVGLAEASADLETSAKEGRTEDLERGLAAVDRELELLEAALNRFLSSGDQKSAH